MANYGNGFEWLTLYKMPIHWRKFYFQKLLDAKKKESEEINNPKSTNKITGPNIKVKK